MGLLDSIQNRAASLLRPTSAPQGTATQATPPRPVGFSGESSFERPAHNLLSLDGTGRRAGDSEGYTPPTEEDGAVPADEAQRSPEEREAQEEAVRNAADQCGLVEFTNSAGETERMSFVRDGDDYLVTDSHGNSFRVHPEEGLTEEELLQGVAAFADHWTQYPPHLRGALERINLHPGEMRANYSADDKSFNMGMDDLDEMTFDHEMGHAIGYQAGNQGDNALESIWEDVTGDRGVPEGWTDAMDDDGAAPSEYANRNEREDFGEAWLAYVEARELGPEAVEALREQYPNRVAIMEEIWNGTYEG